jgi:hypothetical protein
VEDRIFVLRLALYLVATLAATLAFATTAAADVEITFFPASESGRTLVTVTGNAVNDVVKLKQTGDKLEITRTGAGVTSGSPECTVITDGRSCDLPESVSIDLQAGDDTLTTENVNLQLAIAGGAGNDHLSGGNANDVLAGGDNADTLTGGGGVDEYFGEAGGDTINSRDGIAERISCGADNDVVDNDFIDIIAECERGTDNDGDGFSTAVDCNDLARNIFPGAPDPENGIDENCNGQDDRNLDRDGDGFPVPADCDDGNAAIRPNAPEVRGNVVDENCDRRAEPFAELPSLVSTSWKLGRSTTRLRKLVVRNAPAGARIAASCSGPGCTLQRTRRVTVRRNLAPVFLHRFFGRGRFRPGARVTVAVTATGAIGRTYTYRIKRGVLPLAEIVCKPPGTAKGRKC